jgi:predicted nucleic acid-binding protein
VRIVLDNAVLVRGHGSATGLGRDLPVSIVESDHVLLLSNEMLYELASVLGYPRMRALYGLSEQRIYDYIGLLREAAEMVILSPFAVMPIRDVNSPALRSYAAPIN